MEERPLPRLVQWPDDLATMKPKSLHDQIAGKCIHFNGIQNKTCRAGVCYDELDKENRMAYRAALPCWKPDAESLERLAGKPQCQCAHVEFPTEEEVQRQLAEHDKHMGKMMMALTAVDPIRKKYKGKDFVGVIECPVCKGKLHVSHAAYNGHVHAKCETADCVAWME